jgi:hypothetical protein
MRFRSLLLATALVSSTPLGCRAKQTPAPAPLPAPSASTPLPDSRREITRDLQLAQGTLRVIVRFDAGHEAWGEYVASTVTRYLPAAEAYLDRPLHQAAARLFETPGFTVVVNGRDEVHLGTVPIRAYNNTGGAFGPDRGIFIEYSLAGVGNPAVICHELTHFWFADRSPLTHVAKDPHGVPWLNEGVASMLPLVAAQEGTLHLDAGEIAAIRRHWGFNNIPKVDAPVGEDLRPRGQPWLAVFYGKTFKTQYLIHEELGRDGYQRFLRAAVQHHPRTSDDVLALLQEIQPNDWRTLLAGWVFEGPYGKYPQAFFLE